MHKQIYILMVLSLGNTFLLTLIFSQSSDKILLQILPRIFANSLSISKSINISQINFDTFENNSLGIKVQYPSDWIVLQNDTRLGTSINFFSPLTSKVSSVGAFSIDITHISPNHSFKDYIFTYNYALKKYHPTVKVDLSNYTTFAGHPAYEMMFNDEKGYKIFQIWIANNNTVYHIVYPIAKFTSVSLMNKILNSFQIKEITNGTIEYNETKQLEILNSTINDSKHQTAIAVSNNIKA